MEMMNHDHRVVAELFEQFDPMLTTVLQFQLRSMFSQLVMMRVSVDDDDDDHQVCAQQIALEYTCLPLLSIGEVSGSENVDSEQMVSVEGSTRESVEFVSVLQRCFFRFLELPASAALESNVAALDRLLARVVLPILLFEEEEEREEEKMVKMVNLGDSWMHGLVSHVLLGRVDWEDGDDDSNNQQSDTVSHSVHNDSARPKGMIDGHIKQRLRDMKFKLHGHLMRKVVPQAQHLLLVQVSHILPQLHVRVRKWALRTLFYPETKSIIEKKRTIAEKTLQAHKNDLDPFFHLEPLVLLTRQKQQEQQLQEQGQQTLAIEDAHKTGITRSEMLFRVIDQMLDNCRQLADNNGMSSDETLKKIIRILRQSHKLLLTGNVMELMSRERKNRQNNSAAESTVTLMLTNANAVRLVSHLTQIMSHVSIRLHIASNRDNLSKCARWSLKCLSLVFPFLVESVHKRHVLEQAVVKLIASLCEHERQPHSLIARLQRFICREIVGTRSHDTLFETKAQFRSIVIDGIIKRCMLGPLTTDIPCYILDCTDSSMRSFKQDITLIENSFLMWTRSCIRLMDRIMDMHSSQNPSISKMQYQLLHHSATAPLDTSPWEIRAKKTRRMLRSQFNSIFRHLIFTLYLLHKNDANARGATKSDDHKYDELNLEETCTVCRAALLSIIMHRDAAALRWDHQTQLLSAKNARLLKLVFGSSVIEIEPV